MKKKLQPIFIYSFICIVLFFQSNQFIYLYLDDDDDHEDITTTRSQWAEQNLKTWTHHHHFIGPRFKPFNSEEKKGIIPSNCPNVSYVTIVRYCVIGLIGLLENFWRTDQFCFVCVCVVCLLVQQFGMDDGDYYPREKKIKG